MNNHIDNIKKSTVICPYQSENNIEFKKVVDSFFNNWRLFIIIIGFFSIISFVASLFIPKSYEVTSTILPPNDSDINRLNSFRYYADDLSDDDFYLTVEKTYLLFLDNLRSDNLRKKFLLENKLMLKIKEDVGINNNTIISLSEDFSENIKVNYSGSGPNDTKFINVEFIWSNQEYISEILNSYIDFVDKETIESIDDAIKQKVVIERQSIHDKIESLRTIAEINRKNQIVKIKEDLNVAQQVEMLDPLNVPIITYTQTIDNKLGKIENKSESAGFMKGVKALKAELNTIVDRKNNDPFIPGLQEVLEKEEYLKRVLKFTLNDVHAARIDKIAVKPDKPIRPNKYLIVGVGFAFGFLVSIFFILIKEIIGKNN